MAVDISRVLWHEWDDLGKGDEIRLVAEAFYLWKAKNPHLQSRRFGRDYPYRNPLVNGEYELWHVHLEPASGSAARHKWDYAHSRGREKRSDRALIYARDGQGSFLLIYILQQNAHDIADMRTADDRRAMMFFARLAGAWRDDREAMTDWYELIA